jgi:DNA-binding PadR family transcriptional regulator
MRRLNALGFTDVVDGTVYTILVRAEKNKLVAIEKKRPIWGRCTSFMRSTTQGARN